MAEADMHVPTPKINNESSLVRSSRSSLNSVTEQKKQEVKPMKGSVSKRELTFREKLKRSFVKEDVVDIRDYVIFEIIIPGIRKGVFDAIVGTAAQIFGISVPSSFGSLRSGQQKSRLTPHERRYRDYSSISQGQPFEYSSDSRVRRYDRFYASDWTFDYKEDADSALEQLIDICDDRGYVTVAKFFALVDPNGTMQGKHPYTNNDYGWRNLDNATVKFSHGEGYYLDLPPARPL